MSSGEIGRGVFQSFRQGWDLGEGLAERRNERQAGEAMAELAGFDPERALAAEDDALNASEQAIEEGGAFGQQTDGKAKLPSGRDWVTLRMEALKRAGRMGPDAVKSAMDEIDRLQKKGTLDNLYRARMLVEQGRDAEAGTYLERANSYMGNFASLVTSPARMRDGSTKLAFSLTDEQTQQPKAPAMFATPEVLDGLIAMIEKEGDWAQWSQDRAMAEREYQFEREKFEADEAYRYNRAAEDDYQWSSEYNLDLAKEIADAQKPDGSYDIGDMNQTVKTYIDLLPKTIRTDQYGEQTEAVDDKLVSDFLYYFQQGLTDPELQGAVHPDEIARLVHEKLTRGYTSGGASNQPGPSAVAAP